MFLPKKIIFFAITVVLIFVAGYCIKEQYYFQGHEYVGEWVGIDRNGNSQATIQHEGNHFIINRWSGGRAQFSNAHLTNTAELEVNASTSDKEYIKYTYLAANDTIMDNYGIYYKKK